MEYKRLGDGTHAVGFWFDGRFIIYAYAFDAREGKALAKTVRSVFELSRATSGYWVTMVGDAERPRGASAKVKAKGRVTPKRRPRAPMSK